MSCLRVTTIVLPSSTPRRPQNPATDHDVTQALGDARLSACILRGTGSIDTDLLRRALGSAVAEQRPVVLLGATSAFVNLCGWSDKEGLRWSLPPGSRLVDAGGPKWQTTPITVDAMRAMAERIFGIRPKRHTNLFGMTELASQLYDCADTALGPLGERPKGAEHFVRPRVRDPFNLALMKHGRGLLEVVDLCVLDRPATLLTGDLATAGRQGVTITGRVERTRPRGCSLTLDEMPRREGHG